MSFQEIILLLTTYKYIILFPLAALEGPMVALVVGFLIYNETLSFLPAYLILLLGDLIPDSIYYFIGYFWGNQKLVQKIITRSNFFSNNLNIIKRLWLEHSKKTMFFGKLAYGLSIPILISAWMVKMPFRKFVIYAIAVSMFQYWIIMLIGYLLWKIFIIASAYINLAYYLVAILLIILIIIYISMQKYARQKMIMLEKEGENEIILSNKQ